MYKIDLLFHMLSIVTITHLLEISAYYTIVYHHLIIPYYLYNHFEFFPDFSHFQHKLNYRLFFTVFFHNISLTFPFPLAVKAVDTSGLAA